MRHSTAIDSVAPTPASRLPQLLRVDRTFGVIDAALAFVAVWMVASSQLVLLLQATFLLLMVGACYWRLPGLVARALLWGGVATAEVVAAVSQEVLPSSQLRQLPLLSAMLVIVFVLASRRTRVERTLTHTELHDQLTGLPNRSHFLRRLDESLASVSTDQRAVAVISLDIDGFQAVNDDYGQAVADRLLVALGERLRGCVRGDDTVARVGGDEFLIVVRTEPGTVPRIAERLAAAVEAPYVLDGVELRVTASLGVALSETPSAGTRNDLVRHADAALRRVKSEGRAGYEVFSPSLVAASW